ncbi:transglutaminase-like domain-containing protein [Lysinibacillus telephonicus]|nr:transglutaminase-like domain-containing protein [Lysinibacillus telephonicus]
MQITLPKVLISIGMVLLLGACSSGNETLTKDVELEMKFVSNVDLAQFDLSPEEVLQLLNTESDNYKSIDPSSIKIDGAALKNQNDTLTLDFSNQKEVLADYKTQGYNATVYEYPVTVNFEATPTNENAQTEYKFVNLGVLDYYNGALINEQYSVTDTNSSAQIYLEKLFEAKQTAWDNDLIINEILKAPTAKNPEDAYEIAQNGFNYISNTFDYDTEKAELLKETINNYTNAEGIENFVQTKKGVCFDFAYFYKLYLDTYNVENRLAFGNFEGESKKINHVWNEIKINDEWVPVDTTGNGFDKNRKYDNYVSVYTTNL